MGDKAERALIRTPPTPITPPPPTAIDSTISPDEIPLLQFAYSDRFLNGAGTLVGNLFRKFAFLFGTSINSKSLRHAALAWAAAFVRPANDFRFWEQMQHHSTCVARALKSKTESTIELADLYAAFLLTLLSGSYDDGARYVIHLRGVKAILAILSDTISEQRKSLTIFLPLVRDLLLETSRFVGAHFLPNHEILEIMVFFQSAIGAVTHIQRDGYFDVLFGAESRMQFTFLQAIWHHTTTLQRCFRDSLTRQVDDGIGNSPVVQSLVAEIKSDLQSIKVKEIVNQLVILQSLPSAETANHIAHDSSMSMYALLLHRFCWYLIAILEEESILGSLSSIRVASSASALLPLVDETWLVGDLVQPVPTPLHLRRGVVVRILWMVGLVMDPKKYPEGSCLCP